MSRGVLPQTFACLKDIGWKSKSISHTLAHVAIPAGDQEFLITLQNTIRLQSK
jgi:hypothetical protein